jgi:hypothetical protein
MNSEHIRRVAINPLLIDKNAVGEPILYRKNWIETEATLKELAEALATHGWAICPVMAEGIRSAKNFVSADFAAVDIDNAGSVDEVLAHPLVQEHGGFLYTTVSHTDREAHVRVVFELPRTITKPEHCAALLRAIALRLGGDPRATDAARISFGNRNAELHFIGQQLSPEILDELIAQGLSYRAPDNAADGLARSKLRAGWI